MNPLRQWAPEFIRRKLWDRDFEKGLWSRPNTPKGGQENIDPVCIAHGKKKSEHACLICCLCFKSLTHEECSFLPSGTRTNVCVPCAEMEDKAGLQLISTLRADKARLERMVAAFDAENPLSDGYLEVKSSDETVFTKHCYFCVREKGTPHRENCLVGKLEAAQARVRELEEGK